MKLDRTFTRRGVIGVLLGVGIGLAAARAPAQLNPRNIRTEFERADGSTVIEPATPIVAGSWGQWRVTFTAGRGGVRPGGAIRCAIYRATWSRPQLTNPLGEGYTSIASSSEAEFSARILLEEEQRELGIIGDSREHFVEVAFGAVGLAEGESISITYGDRSAGGPGARAAVIPYAYTQTAKKAWPTPVVPLNVTVRRTSSGDFLPLREERAHELEIVTAAADRLFVANRAHALAGEALTINVVLADHFNQLATPFAAGRARWAVQDLARGELRPWSDPIDFTAANEGRFNINVALSRPGAFSVRVSAEVEGKDGLLLGEGNPIRITNEPQEENIWWGDLHSHTIWWDGLGTSEENLRYAREVSRLDFVSVTPHFPEAEFRDDLERMTNKYHDPPRFTALQGFEGFTPGGRGHRNYFTATDRQPPEQDRYSKTPWDFLAGREGDILMIPHAMKASDDPSSWDYRSPKFMSPDWQSVVEIHSLWGSSEVRDGPMWRNDFFNAKAPYANGISAQEILATGARVGFIGSSDNHTGRPGLVRENVMPLDRYPNFAYPAGLVGVIAPENTRRAIFDAIRNRRTYATTGRRIVLDYSVNGKPMGSEMFVRGRPQPKIEAKIIGTAPIASVTVVRNNRDIFTRKGEGRVMGFSYQDVDAPRPAPTNYYYLRIVQSDGAVAWGSPVWITNRRARFPLEPRR